MDKIQKYTFVIDEETQSTRLDLVLSLQLVDGKVCRLKKYKVSLGEAIEITLPPPKELKAEAENIPIEIVYEDDDLLVVNKPRGMVVHPAAGIENGSLVNALMYHCQGRLSSINGVIRPGIVHRIDKDTRGLLVVAKNDTAHECLSAQLAELTIVRRYEALVFNNLSEEEGTIDEPIGRDPSSRIRQAVIHGGGNA